MATQPPPSTHHHHRTNINAAITLTATISCLQHALPALSRSPHACAIRTPPLSHPPPMPQHIRPRNTLPALYVFWELALLPLCFHFIYRWLVRSFGGARFLPLAQRECLRGQISSRALRRTARARRRPTDLARGCHARQVAPHRGRLSSLQRQVTPTREPPMLVGRRPAAPSFRWRVTRLRSRWGHDDDRCRLVEVGDRAVGERGVRSGRPWSDCVAR